METKTLPPGSSWQVTLKGHGTTGYQWQFKISPKNIVSVSLAEQIRNKEKVILPGASTDEVFTVKALKKGTANIHFYLVRSWEDDSQKPKEEKEIQIVVG